MTMKPRLGVNIDHIATLREARKEWYPDPFESLFILKKTGVAQVTLHLREDRRHIQDHDLKRIVAAGVLPVNLEMATTDAMVRIALKSGVSTCTLVPEKRQEITTEGGLDVAQNFKRVASAVRRLKIADKKVSLFIDPNTAQIEASMRSGADAVEFHTGTYCHVLERYFLRRGSYALKGEDQLALKVRTELKNLKEAADRAAAAGLQVYAGHGLHRHNLAPVVKISAITEYNIGHAIVARAVFVGLQQAILEIQKVLRKR